MTGSMFIPGIPPDALLKEGPGTITNDSSSHALQIINETDNDSSSETVDILSHNELDTALGIKGVERGRGTIKVTHQKPPSGADDANASVLSLRCNGAGTKAQGVFFDSEDGPTTGKLINFRQGGVEKFVINADGEISVGGRNLTEFHEKRRAEDAVTMPDTEANGNFTLTSGLAYGAVAFVRKAGTYTKIRLCTGSAPSGLTEVRGAVWDSGGLVLAQTADIKAAFTGANVLVEQALDAGLPLAELQQIYIGLVWVGTTLNMRGASLSSALAGARGSRAFQLARAVAGYTGGGAPTLTSGSTGSMLWGSLVV